MLIKSSSILLELSGFNSSQISLSNTYQIKIYYIDLLKWEDLPFAFPVAIAIKFQRDKPKGNNGYVFTFDIVLLSFCTVNNKTPPKNKQFFFLPSYLVKRDLAKEAQTIFSREFIRTTRRKQAGAFLDKNITEQTMDSFSNRIIIPFSLQWNHLNLTGRKLLWLRLRLRGKSK